MTFQPPKLLRCLKGQPCEVSSYLAVELGAFVEAAV
jgi:hypothetical protein